MTAALVMDTQCPGLWARSKDEKVIGVVRLHKVVLIYQHKSRAPGFFNHDLRCRLCRGHQPRICGMNGRATRQRKNQEEEQIAHEKVKGSSGPPLVIT